MNKKNEVWEYKYITCEMMMEYIKKNAPQDKDWFKSVALHNGKYEHLYARKQFCLRYMPEIIPVAKEKRVPKADLLMNW